MKKVLSFVVIIFALVFGQASQSFAMSFTDVPDTHRFAPNVSHLFNEGIIKGFGNNKFGPDEPVTRAASAIMLAKALDLDTSNTKTGFTDVSESSKAAGAIQALKAKGMIAGFPDGNFHPSREVTRAEMAILLANAFKLEEKTYLSFTDVSRNMKSYDAIRKVVAFGVATGYTSEKYNPHDSLTRGQFAAFLSRTMSEEFRLTPKKPGDEKITKAESYAIASQLTPEFMGKVSELGEENSWGINNPGTVEISKPVLQEYLSENFISLKLKLYIEDYYCDCDRISLPKVENEMLRFTVSGVTKDAFTITGLYLPTLINTEPWYHSIIFKVEDGKWKIDDWKVDMEIPINLNLTKQEVEKGVMEAQVIGDFQLEEAGGTVYIVDQKGADFLYGIGKNDGKLYDLSN